VNSNHKALLAVPEQIPGPGRAGPGRGNDVRTESHFWNTRVFCFPGNFTAALGSRTQHNTMVTAARPTANMHGVPYASKENLAFRHSNIATQENIVKIYCKSNF
jgi:hypothetical protein